MDKPMPKFHFKRMSSMFKLRDFFRPRKHILKKVGIEPGFHVLDYGCGPGSYIIPLAGLVGKSGKVYALDIHPLAIERVQSIASKKGLTNVKTIASSGCTELPDETIDVILLYDTLHHLSDPQKVLKELHRLLKPTGILSLSDHHMKEDEILSKLTSRGLFKLSKKGKRTYSFLKKVQHGPSLPDTN